MAKCDTIIILAGLWMRREESENETNLSKNRKSDFGVTLPRTFSFTLSRLLMDNRYNTFLSFNSCECVGVYTFVNRFLSLFFLLLLRGKVRHAYLGCVVVS